MTTATNTTSVKLVDGDFHAVIQMGLNDAAFLSALVSTYIYQNKQEQNDYLVNLCKALNPKAGC